MEEWDVPMHEPRQPRPKSFARNRLAARGVMFVGHGLTLIAILVAYPTIAEQKAETGSRSPLSTITIDQIAGQPDIPEVAASLRWSPDGSRVAWMHLLPPLPRAKDKTPQQEIWSLTNSLGKAQPPSLLVSTVRVTASLVGHEAPSHPPADDDNDKANPFLLHDFQWVRGRGNSNASLLLKGEQSLALLDPTSGKSTVLLSGSTPLVDVSLSPDSLSVSFIRDHCIWIVPVSGGPPRQFTHAMHPDLLEGELDWTYRNELHLNRGYEWSPDSSRIAWLQVSDRAVDRYGLKASDGSTREIAYPKPGGVLPVARVFVERTAGGPPVEINLGSTKDSYVPKIAWLPDGRHLAIERIDRYQHKLDLFLADVVTGKTRLLLSEQDRYWINLSDDLYFFKDGQRFLWTSQKNTGFRHLYLYDLRGKQLAQLTTGDWEVTHVDSIDEANGRVYFTGTKKSPLERQLYRVDLDGGNLEQITQAAGTHQAIFAPIGSSFADVFSTHATPPQVELSSPDKPQELPSPIPTNQPSLVPVEFRTLDLHFVDQVYTLMIRPPGFDPAQKYPVIFYVAGGPGDQFVRDIWAGATGLWLQSMAQKGYLIYSLDYHGSAGRGHLFEEPVHLRFSGQELADIRDGVAYLKGLPYVDAERMGICGWGFGGFLVVHAMLDRPVSFQAGFAGAPITDWNYYDATFSERYLDDPIIHADGWRASTAFDNARYLKGELMIAQGTDDEFVHMENAFKLQDRLLDVGKSSILLLFPDRGHSIEDPPSRRVLFTRMTDFFLKNLQLQRPARNSTGGNPSEK